MLTTNAMARPRPRLIWPNLPPSEMSCLSTCARSRMQFRLTTDSSLLHISPSSSKITASLHSGPRQPPSPPHTTLVLFSCAGSPPPKKRKELSLYNPALKIFRCGSRQWGTCKEFKDGLRLGKGTFFKIYFIYQGHR